MKNTVTHFAGVPLGASSFEALDRLALVEMRPYGMSQGILPSLYSMLRTEGSLPLSRQAAEQILERPGAPTAIFTGMQIPGYMPVGETDGPVGVAVLAHVLHEIGHPVTVVVEPEIVPIMRHLLNITMENTEPVRVIASDDSDAYDELETTAEIAIAIEKLGPNEKGTRHSVGGTAVLTGDDRAGDFFNNLRRRGAFTLGVGDNGNEIGFGKIAHQARGIVPWGEICRCECAGGIVTAIGTDVVLPCAVSNYGAYVVSVSLACLLEREELLPNPSVISKLVSDAVQHGMVNGAIENDDEFIGDDGIPLAAVEAFAQLFRTVGTQYFTRVGDHR